MFLRYDREGVGRQAGHNSWCSSLSLPRQPGKLPLSWPEVPWCIHWISSLPQHSCRASPSGMKHLQEIWVQKFPARNELESQRSVWLLSKSYKACPPSHTSSAANIRLPLSACVWEYINVIIIVTGSYNTLIWKMVSDNCPIISLYRWENLSYRLFIFGPTNNMP